jgi:hypothetical protein
VFVLVSLVLSWLLPVVLVAFGGFRFWRYWSSRHH